MRVCLGVFICVYVYICMFFFVVFIICFSIHSVLLMYILLFVAFGLCFYLNLQCLYYYCIFVCSLFICEYIGIRKGMCMYIFIIIR